VALLMIKTKHKCTISLMVDLLKLLAILRVTNVPSSWHQLKEQIKKAERSTGVDQKMIDATVYFCPECERECVKPDKCTNKDCAPNGNVSTTPHTLLVMNVKQQIEQLLLSVNREDLHLPRRMESPSLPMKDIYHGQVYADVFRSLQNEDKKLFVSLSCNIDGVAVYTSSEQSMWTFTACVNELKRSIRFDLERIIGESPFFSTFLHLIDLILVLGISVGRKKPSKSIMQKMLHPIVLRLKELQKAILYRILDGSYEILRVYLIGISNDKPANSLVQNQAEPNAMYGCSKCEIAGNLVSDSQINCIESLSLLPGHTTPARLQAKPNQSTKITTTYVRVFPTPSNDEPGLRSNARWCEISHAIRNGVRFFAKDKKLHTFGYMGDCELTDLAFVDRGTSFMSDTLHSIYHGAFVCMEDVCPSETH
jgi:hypothetical protein